MYNSVLSYNKTVSTTASIEVIAAHMQREDEDVTRNPTQELAGLFTFRSFSSAEKLPWALHVYRYM